MILMIFLSLLSSSNKHQMAQKITSLFVSGVGGTHASGMQSLCAILHDQYEFNI